MGRTLSRVAGVVFAGALATFAAAPAALAQTETETTTASSPAETTPETTTAPPASETTTTSGPVTTTGTTSAPATTEVTPTTTPKTTTTETSEPPKDDDYQDNTGAGFVGVGGEGVLVIACASGAPGNVATQYLSVTGGPDQEESDGRYWNYSVRVENAPAGTTTAKFSWTCNGVEGNGIVEFQPEEPPATSTSAPAPSTSAPATSTSAPASSTAPVTTATSAAAGNSAPAAQVKVEPKGGIETGFGGTAW